MTRRRSVADFSSVYALGKSASGAPGGTSSIAMTLTADCSNLQIIFGNFHGDFGGGTAEVMPTSPIVVSAAIWFDEAPVRMVVCSFSGSRQTSIRPGELIRTDPLPGPFRRGTRLRVRTFVQVESGKTYPLATVAISASSEGFAPGVDLTAATAEQTTWPVVDTPVYGPALVTADVAAAGASGPQAVAGIGDSIMEGLGDIRGRSSFFTRALGQTFGHVCLAKASAGTDEFLIDHMNARRPLLAAADWALNTLGINDVCRNVNLSTIIENNLRIGSMCREAGGCAVLATLLPCVEEQGSFETIERQVPSQFESVRAAYNAWVRDGAPIPDPTRGASRTSRSVIVAGEPNHPYASVIDLAAAVEVDASNTFVANGGRWACGDSIPLAKGDPSTRSLTYDGTHLTTLGHGILSSSLRPYLERLERPVSSGGCTLGIGFDAMK